jgi:hypothetical protein
MRWFRSINPRYRHARIQHLLKSIIRTERAILTHSAYRLLESLVVLLADPGWYLGMALTLSLGSRRARGQRLA